MNFGYYAHEEEESKGNSKHVDLNFTAGMFDIIWYYGLLI